MSLVALILAADPGERLKSSLPNALHPVLGDPSLLWVLRALPPDVSATVIAAPRPGGSVEEALAQWQLQGLLPCPCTLVEAAAGQEVQAAADELNRLGATKILLVSGATPLLKPSTLAMLAASEGMRLPSEQPTPACLPWKDLETAVIRGACTWMQAAAGLPSAASCAPEELLGLGSRQAQAALQALARTQLNDRWMDAGVSFLDPASTVVGPRVQLAADVVLEPGVCLEGGTTVAGGTRIGQGSVLRNSRIGRDADIRPYCVIQGSKVGAGARIGPFAHLREGSVLEERVHVGNFVETKKAILRTGAKANHLSYLGDAEVGERTNLGAGFISCNYDGFRKHRTIIGRDAFVGSDCQLVAPVTIGDGAMLGAGSTITEDIPPDALALTRAPLVVKKGAAGRLREKLRAMQVKT